MARGDGLRVRLSRIRGETLKGVLLRPIYLPAVIDGFGWSETFLHTEYDTVRSGQFSQPSMGDATARQLRATDDVGTLTVEWDAPWLVESGQDPDAVYDALFSIGRSRSPVTLLATPKIGIGRPLLRMDVTMRSIHAELRRGEPDTMYYTCAIKEWRNPTTKRKGAGKGRRDKFPTTHELTATDTLYTLAMEFYGSAAYAIDIAKANGILMWGKSTPLVQNTRYRVGSKIKLPLVTSRSAPVVLNVSGTRRQPITGR